MTLLVESVVLGDPVTSFPTSIDPSTQNFSKNFHLSRWETGLTVMQSMVVKGFSGKRRLFGGWMKGTFQKQMAQEPGSVFSSVIYLLSLL
jgi:hypothetical protein